MSSRFLNVSPRAFLRQKDSVNVLPSIERTGNQNEQGNDSVTFSESRNTLVFENQNVRAPYMIPLNRAALSGFSLGTIVLSASVSDKNAYLETAISNPEIYPYKEGQNKVAFEALGAGFPEEEYPGFSSSDKDKSIITFDLTTNSSVSIYKLNANESARDASGPFLSQNRSGFVYFNHSQRTWSDIGIRDRASNSLKAYNPVIEITGALAAGKYDVTLSGTQNILSQFAGSPYSIVTETPGYAPKDDDALRARGYHRIGEPTSFFGAPHSPRYHARQNESVRLSDYISSPFIVDRIVVNLPVTATRTQVPNAPTAYGFARDVDNYVFFVYVQNRTNGARKDTRQDVSGSIRYLIGKESFCFYNVATMEKVKMGQKPIHSYGQAEAFTMIENPVGTAAVSQTIDANIFLNFRPQTFNNYFGTISRMPGAGYDLVAATEVTGAVFIANFWRGGQYASGNMGNVYRAPDTKNLNTVTGSDFTGQKNLFATPSPRSLVSSFWEGSNFLIRSGSGVSETALEIPSVTISGPSKQTPVILFPDDELIFGIESGVNSIMQTPGRTGLGYDQDVLAVTGSRLQIRAGNASVSLYGTLVREGREVLPGLNQYLGSDAVHEDIHQEGPVDQFDILSPSILSASYVDNLFGIRSGTRKRIGLASRGQGWITGSLQRNVRHFDDRRTYYDTLVPTIPEISSSLFGTFTGIVDDEVSSDSSILKIIPDSAPNYAFENVRYTGLTDKLLTRPFTYEFHSGKRRIRNFQLNIYSTSFKLVRTHTGESAKFVLYYNGENETIDDLYVYDKAYSGAASLRYGLLSPRLISPSVIFRRDRYGQVRDMLEQSRDSKFVINQDGKDSVIRGSVVATFVSSSSDLATTAESTQCSNLSVECTSSVPFTDDGNARNRGALPAYSVKFGPNNLIFGVTGSFGYQ